MLFQCSVGNDARKSYKSSQKAPTVEKKKSLLGNVTLDCVNNTDVKHTSLYSIDTYTQRAKQAAVKAWWSLQGRSLAWPLRDPPVPRRHYIYPSATFKYHHHHHPHHHHHHHHHHHLNTAILRCTGSTLPLARSQPVAVGQSAPSENLTSVPFSLNDSP